jgi:CDP-diglyceride synthetase
MFKRKDLLGFIGIIILFSIGLIGFYLFSEPYGDGLEKTMVSAEVEESDPVYSAPLDYGDNYLYTFSLGCIGFAITLLIVYLLSWLLRKSNAPQQR